MGARSRESLRTGGLRGKIVRATAMLLMATGIASLVVVGLVEIELSEADNLVLEARIRETLLARGESLVKSHAGVFRSLVRDTAVTEMQSTVADAVSQQDVVYGAFIDHEGRSWAYCSPTQDCASPLEAREILVVESAAVRRELKLPDTAEPTRLQTRELEAFSLPIVEFAHPVVLEGEQVGVLRYGISTKPLSQTLEAMHRRREEWLRSGLMTIAAVVAMSLLIGVWFARRLAVRITEPLKYLTGASTRLAGGDRAVRVNIRSGDELEILGDSFNAMSSELESSYSALEATNRDLRKEVEERKLAQRERSELQDHLIQSQKMEAFGQLAGGVAHDFNNILAIIVGNTELLRFAVDEDEAEEAMALNEEIAQAAERGANLTRQLLTFARKETDNPRIVDVNGTLAGFEKLIRRVLEESVAVIVKTTSPIPRVLIDPGRLEQVLMNLCVNARDAMDGTGTLELRTDSVTLVEETRLTSGLAAPGRYVTIEAVDSGKGIAAEDVPRVFEPFFTTKPAGQGTGLGLATVHGIVRDAGGQIEVESVLGEGTCFRIYLPSTEAEEPVDRGTAPIKLSDGRGAAVLLCEDDESVRLMMTRLLKRAGYSVHSVASAVQALELLEKRRFDLLVTDAVMPEMDGGELSQAAQKIHPDLPLLFVSGYTGGILESCGVKEDSLNFLRKPFRAAEFLSRIESLITGEASEGKS